MKRPVHSIDLLTSSHLFFSTSATMAAIQPQTQQLEFNQAMSDFRTMFPDMDPDVIEAVLRANQGAVDATIDQLLAMSTDNENEKLRTELDKRDKGRRVSPWMPPVTSPSHQAPPPVIVATPPCPKEDPPSRYCVLTLCTFNFYKTIAKTEI